MTYTMVLATSYYTTTTYSNTTRSELRANINQYWLNAPSAFSFSSIAIWGRARASGRANIAPILPISSSLAFIQLSLHAYIRGQLLGLLSTITNLARSGDANQTSQHRFFVFVYSVHLVRDRLLTHQQQRQSPEDGSEYTKKTRLVHDAVVAWAARLTDVVLSAFSRTDIYPANDKVTKKSSSSLHLLTFEAASKGKPRPGFRCFHRQRVHARLLRAAPWPGDWIKKPKYPGIATPVRPSICGSRWTMNH